MKPARLRISSAGPGRLLTIQAQEDWPMAIMAGARAGKDTLVAAQGVLAWFIPVPLLRNRYIRLPDHGFCAGKKV